MALMTALFTDADNTLWDTDAVYARAQRAMLAAVGRHVDVTVGRTPREALAFLRRIDQRIAAQHLKGLRYPPELLALGLCRALKGDEEGAVELKALECEDASSLNTIVEEYVGLLRAFPEKRKGVSRGLKLAHEMGASVTVVTEGDRARCIELLEHHRLAGFVDGVVSMKKSVNAYRSIYNRSVPALMVGDQPDRDILFACRAGLSTCYFPGNFAPFWSADISVTPDFQIESYLEVPAALRRLHMNSRQPRKVAVLGRRRL